MSRREHVCRILTACLNSVGIWLMWMRPQTVAALAGSCLVIVGSIISWPYLRSDFQDWRKRRKG